MAIDFKKIKCPSCGGDLEFLGDLYSCKKCSKMWTTEYLENNNRDKRLF